MRRCVGLEVSRAFGIKRLLKKSVVPGSAFRRLSNALALGTGHVRFQDDMESEESEQDRFGIIIDKLLGVKTILLPFQSLKGEQAKTYCDESLGRRIQCYR